MRLVNMELVFTHYKTSVFNFNYKKMFPYKKTPFTFYPAIYRAVSLPLINVSLYIFYLQSLLKPYLLVQMYAFDFYLQQIY